MTEYRFIRYEVADRIARITLDRERYRNVQSTEMLQELHQAILRAGEDREIRVIVLFAVGDHFSAGHDLGTPEEMAWREKNPIQQGTRGFYDRTWSLYVDMHLAWRNVPKPMLAAVQGYCIFGGWMVASTADIIFAAEDAMFLGSLFQYFAIPYDIHPRRAKELLFQGRFVNGGQAKELGLVNRVVPRAALVDEVLAYAHDVSQNDPFEMRMIKLAVNQAQDQQGFTAFIHAAHSMYMLNRTAEKDPDYAVKVPEGRRRPMVQVALERYQRDLAKSKGDQSSK
jgi:enoyl-CoA hydratase